MSLIFATQLTAVATAVLAIGAIVTGILAYPAFRKQARQVDILVKENNRQATERRRAQAARVFVGAPPRVHTGTIPPARIVWPPATALNASDFPVYDVQSWYSLEGELKQSTNHGVILPGRASDSSVWSSRGDDDAIAHTILTFRDATGVRWVRMPDGILTEQKHPTARESVLAALRQLLSAPATGTSEAGEGQKDIPGK